MTAAVLKRCFQIKLLVEKDIVAKDSIIKIRFNDILGP